MFMNFGGNTMVSIIVYFWNYYTPKLFFSFGIVITLLGIYWGIERARKELKHPGRALAIARSLRVVLIGLSIMGAGIGWMWNIESLLLLSLIIGCEELLETSIVIATLKRPLRHNS